MTVLDALRRDWNGLLSYERFEHFVLRILLAATSLIILYTLTLAVIDLVEDVGLGMDFLETQVLQDIFGSFLTVLILLEFNHSIATSLRTHTATLQVRTVVLIAILVVARKCILLDFKTTQLEIFAGIGGLGLVLGALYWLMADADRRRAGRKHPAEAGAAAVPAP